MRAVHYQDSRAEALRLARQDVASNEQGIIGLYARTLVDLVEQYEVTTQERDQIEKTLADEMREKDAILKNLRSIEEQLQTLQRTVLEIERLAIGSRASPDTLERIGNLATLTRLGSKR